MKMLDMKNVLLILAMCFGIMLPDIIYGNNPESGCSETGLFALIGNGDPNYGYFTVYYDDLTNKSMTIRIKGTNASYYYCVENDNPKLYSIVLTFIQKHMDGWSTYGNKNSDGSRAGYNHYRFLNFWYKTNNGKNMIKGIGVRGE